MCGAIPWVRTRKGLRRQWRLKGRAEGEAKSTARSAGREPLPVHHLITAPPPGGVFVLGDSALAYFGLDGSFYTTSYTTSYTTRPVFCARIEKLALSSRIYMARYLRKRVNRKPPTAPAARSRKRQAPKL